MISSSSLIGFKPGQKKVNQDALLTLQLHCETVNKNKGKTILIVCDGHGVEGEVVSSFVTQAIAKQYLDLEEPNEKTLSSACASVTEKIEKELLEIGQFSGTTCCSLIIYNGKVFCINIGDSRAIARTRNGKLVELSSDHKPDRPDERERIRSKGGHYSEGSLNGDVPRVAGLALSRAFGDLRAVPHGVISVPEISVLDKEVVDFIVLGSDGIFDFLDSQECISFVASFFKSNPPEMYHKVAEELALEARTRWLTEYRGRYVDDCSVIVMYGLNGLTMAKL